MHAAFLMHSALLRCARGKIFNQRKKFSLHQMEMSSFINPCQYLEDIESEILNGDQEFSLKLRSQWAKPIIRTLLGIEQKEEFNKCIRETQKRFEFNRMNEFVYILWSRIQNLSEVEQNKVPDFAFAVKEAQNKQEKGFQAFCRLASGKRYGGQLKNLVNDLAPDLLHHYEQASTPLKDDEIFRVLIEEIASEGLLDDERIEAAMSCVQLFYNKGNLFGNPDSDIVTAIDSKLSGMRSEKECERWLRNQNSSETLQHHRVLPNVMVNDFTTRSRSKYHNQQAWQENRRSNLLSIIWTNQDRNKMCSEFDAVVLEEVSCNDMTNLKILEFWEAKAIISPSSLHDSIAKKLTAARHVINDEASVISYDGYDYFLKSAEEKIRFGLFGIELMSPANAVGQLRSTVAAYMLSNNIDIALSAVKTGTVVIKSDFLLNDIRKLKSSMENIQDFDVVIKIS